MANQRGARGGNRTRHKLLSAALFLFLLSGPVLLSVVAQPPAGSKLMSAKLPSGRDGTASVWAGSVAYVFGGASSSAAFKDILKYDPATDSMETLSVTLPRAVGQATAVWTGSVAYVLGGTLKTSNQFGGGLPDIVKFDPAAGTAALISTRLPVASSAAAAVWTGSQAYVFGGMDQMGQISNRISRYDPATDQAELVPTTLPEGLMGHSAGWDGKYAYIFGGISESFSVQTNIMRFDPATNELVTMNGVTPFPQNQGAAVFDGEDFYLVGGAQDAQYSGSPFVMQYNAASDTASNYDLQLADGVALVSAVWSGDAAYVFGGRDGTSRSSEIQRFVPGEGTVGGSPVGTSGPNGGPGININIRGTVIRTDGTGAGGIPVLLLLLAAGALLAVGATVTQDDGSYNVEQATSQPSHVAVYQDGHLQLRPLDAAQPGQPVPPMEVSQSSQPVQPDELVALRSSFEEARLYPVDTTVSGNATTVDTNGYHGLDRIEVDASGAGLQLVVAKMRGKGLERVPEPSGDVLRWFGVGLVDGSGTEVPINHARLFFTAPAGVAADSSLVLYHLLIREDGSTAWESATATAVGDGLYGVELSSLSLFGVGPASIATPLNRTILYAAAGVAAVGLMGATAWRIRAKRAGASRPAAARVDRPAVLPTSGVALKENEFLIAGLGFETGGKKILSDLSFGFQQGQILALLGPSGSGKSTLLKCIIGENAFDGEVNVFGYHPKRDRDALKRLVGYVAQDTQLYADMTVRENIAYFGKQYGIPKASLNTVVPFLIQTLGLEERTDTPVKVLSGGQQRRASIASTLVASPGLLILDEPTSGLDPITRRNLWKFIRNANRELGVSVIVTTHFLDETEHADRVVILVHGRVVAAGAPQELLRSLPGGGKVVVVELQNTSPAIETRIREAAKPLEKQGLVKKVDITGFTVRFFVENPQAANRPLLDALAVHEVPIKSLTAEDCKMEDVFVHYAGEAWKEPAA